MKTNVFLDLQLFGVGEEEEETKGSAQEQDAAFEELICGQYKEAYERKVQQLQTLLQEEKQARQADRRNYEALELKQQYPDFSLEEELKAQRFRELLEGGMALRTAYELCHGEELLAHLREKSRPRENGMGEQSAAAVMGEVASLSRAQRREIIRRVQRGETIRF